MRQAAGDGPPVPDLHIGGQVRGIQHDRHMLADEWRRRDIRVPAQRTHDEPFAYAFEPGQGLDAVDVHQVARTGDPQLHHRQEALPARQDLGVVAVPRQKFQRFVHGPG